MFLFGLYKYVVLLVVACGSFVAAIIFFLQDELNSYYL